jgi:hypothetical protein
MSWIYNNVEFEPSMIPDKAVGFVYEMSAIINGKPVKYIGKKAFYSRRKKKFSKKNMPTDRRKKNYEIVVKLNYENYYSSNKDLKEAHKKGIPIKRIILQICYSKTELTYQETKLQFVNEVLEKEEYLNGNILGRFYKQIKNE